MLKQHQQAGAADLAVHPRRLLRWQPGMGKTRALLEAFKQRFPLGERLHVIAPAMACSHWYAEASLMDVDIRVQSYDRYVKGQVNPDCASALVLDEIHYLKHAGSLRTQRILGKSGLVRQYETVWGASGTFPPRHPGEAWTVIASLFPDVARRHKLYSTEEFAARFLERVWVEKHIGARTVHEWKIVGMRNDLELRELLAEISTPDVEGFDLPDVWWQPWVIDSQEIEGENFQEIRAVLAAGGSLEEFLSDLSIARYRRNIGLLKAPLVAAAVHDFLENSNEKIVLFAYHTAVLSTLRDHLQRYQPAFVDGSTKDRGAEVARFQTDPNCRVFIGQNVACQTSATLTAARRVIIVEPEWAGYANYQLGKRIARIGQTAEKCVGQMVCLAGTLDEAIVRQNVRETEFAQRMGTETNK